MGMVLSLIHILEAGGLAADVTGREAVLAIHIDAHALGAAVLQLAAEAHLLEVEDDLGDVLNDAFDRAELVFDAIDAETGDGEALQAAQQDAAQAVADGNAVTGLQRAELEGAAGVGGLDHGDLVRSLEI